MEVRKLGEAFSWELTFSTFVGHIMICDFPLHCTGFLACFQGKSQSESTPILFFLARDESSLPSPGSLCLSFSFSLSHFQSLWLLSPTHDTSSDPCCLVFNLCWCLCHMWNFTGPPAYCAVAKHHYSWVLVGYGFVPCADSQKLHTRDGSIINVNTETCTKSYRHSIESNL